MTGATDPLASALDRFDVPPMSAGLTDRIVARATALPASSRWPRDRRGVWRRGRQVLLGTAAVSLLSVAAVASGLLGRVGIEVPVLTAMLAPKAVPKPHAAPHRVAVKQPAPLAPVVAPPPVAVPNVPTPAERMARRIERRERIATFVQEHPRAAAVIAQRMRQRLQLREAERRATLGFPPADPSAPDYRPLTDSERFILMQERRRDLWRMRAMIDRRLAAREARRAAETAPASNAAEAPGEGSSAQPR